MSRAPDRCTPSLGRLLRLVPGWLLGPQNGISHTPEPCPQKPTVWTGKGVKTDHNKKPALPALPAKSALDFGEQNPT